MGGDNSVAVSLSRCCHAPWLSIPAGWLPNVPNGAQGMWGERFGRVVSRS
jgi:hypothetical protein